MVDKLRGQFILSEFIIELAAACKERDFIICLRHKSINVYYLSHSLLKIDMRNGGYICSFSFNHARYTKDYKAELKFLENCGFDVPEEINPKKQNYITIFVDYAGYCKKIDKKFPIRTVLDKLKKLVDDFLLHPGSKVLDYFKGGDDGVESVHHINLEKIDQFKLALDNRDMIDGYCIYDIEFMQPHKNDEEKRADKAGRGRPDALALRYCGGVPAALVFVEVKTKLSSCKDNKNGVGEYTTSGVQKHVDDMLNYILNDDKTEYSARIAERKAEAADAIGKLIDLKLLDGEKPGDLSALPVEIVFAFTRESVKFPVKPSGEKYGINIKSKDFVGEGVWKL